MELLGEVGRMLLYSVSLSNYLKIAKSFSSNISVIILLFLYLFLL